MELSRFIDQFRRCGDYRRIQNMEDERRNPNFRVLWDKESLKKLSKRCSPPPNPVGRLLVDSDDWVPTSEGSSGSDPTYVDDEEEEGSTQEIGFHTFDWPGPSTRSSVRRRRLYSRGDLKEAGNFHPSQSDGNLLGLSQRSSQNIATPPDSPVSGNADIKPSLPWETFSTKPKQRTTLDLDRPKKRQKK